MLSYKIQGTYQYPKTKEQVRHNQSIYEERLTDKVIATTPEPEKSHYIPPFKQTGSVIPINGIIRNRYYQYPITEAHIRHNQRVYLENLDSSISISKINLEAAASSALSDNRFIESNFIQMKANEIPSKVHVRVETPLEESKILLSSSEKHRGPILEEKYTIGGRIRRGKGLGEVSKKRLNVLQGEFEVGNKGIMNRQELLTCSKKLKKKGKISNNKYNDIKKRVLSL